MKKTVKGVVYDTEAMTVVKKVSHGEFGDPAGYEETLYVAENGNYFNRARTATLHVEEHNFRAEDVDKAREWFLKRGSGAVFFCRLIPVVRSLISIPAGLSRMPLIPFLFLTTVGSFLWNTVLVMAGRAAGNSWEKVSEALGVYSDVILMVGGGAVALLMAVHLFRNSKAN